MSSPIQKAEVWEDGLRTDPTKKSFEWWYFDANMDDGSIIVVTFFTKSASNPSGPVRPEVRVTITKPNGEKLNFDNFYPADQMKAETKECNVVMGPNTLKGDLKTYKIHINMPGVEGDVEFTRVAPSFSTNSKGHPQPEYFGWFCAIPYGKVQSKLFYDGETHATKGTGYHDHNWGIINIKDVCQYWYWGRANAGDYAMIFTVMVLPKILGGKHASVFYLAKGDKILIGDSNHLDLTKTNLVPPAPKFGHLPNALTFTYQNENNTVELSLSDPKLIESVDPLEGESGLKKFLTRLFSKPLYVRYNSDMDLKVDMNGKKDEKKGNSLYEIMILH